MKAATAVPRTAPPRDGGKSEVRKALKPRPVPPSGPQGIAASGNGTSAVENPAFTAHFIRSRIGKICVAITGATPAEMLENAERIVRENHFVEFRLDYLP